MANLGLVGTYCNTQYIAFTSLASSWQQLPLLVYMPVVTAVYFRDAGMNMLV